MLFTTSWDDGHPLDFRIADMLDSFGMKGTFYLCRDGQGGEKLSATQITELSERHEVGAHTLTHPSLVSCDDIRLRHEVEDGKAWLEDITQRQCDLFAYPYGHVDERVRNAVKDAGYAGARSTEDLTWDLSDPFLLPTSVQVHHFPFRPVINRRFIQPFLLARPRLRASGISLFSCRNWYAYAVAAFDAARKMRRPFFHLWGHSWTAERDGFMDDIHRFLSYVSHAEGIAYDTNSALLSL